MKDGDLIISTYQAIIWDINSASAKFNHGKNWDCSESSSTHYLSKLKPMEEKKPKLVRQAAIAPKANSPCTDPPLAFLIRPVSRQSTLSATDSSCAGKLPKIRFSEEFRGASVDRYGKLRPSNELRKQKTFECTTQYGGSARNLLTKQSSSTSTNNGVTLVRGASCSLVDIPTYLGPSVAAHGVELAQMLELGSSNIRKGGGGNPSINQLPSHLSRPRLQLDLTKKKVRASNGSKKTKWTVFCVAITLLTMCVTLVGTMLSVGSQYQEIRVSQEWEHFLNHSGSSNTSYSSSIFSTTKDSV